eukprot:CAMPEP_0119364402 /NCGR_PEP_ID=MMETSP1334-20130426/11325_1 /TAXON_ID=127549 /ORGANISM="Calcidiscus leptoporus, Strain RCC1130" /LENGTH=178 /DNA_ID=CAMNT_0007380107 /DNA_START=179 /DNA_END=713 /DNA_ORIENTATION=-
MTALFLKRPGLRLANGHPHDLERGPRLQGEAARHYLCLARHRVRHDLDDRGGDAASLAVELVRDRVGRFLNGPTPRSSRRVEQDLNGRHAPFGAVGGQEVMVSVLPGGFTDVASGEAGDGCAALRAGFRLPLKTSTEASVLPGGFAAVASGEAADGCAAVRAGFAVEVSVLPGGFAAV